MPDLTTNADTEFTESAGTLTARTLRLNDGTNTATAAEVRDLLDGFSTVPSVIYGTATALDANGNPTPDTATYNPALLPEGTLLFATTGPTARDNGTGQTTTFAGVDMRFRVVAGAWVWDGGSFRATNSNGDYQRFADGRQECVAWGFITGDGVLANFSDVHTLPAAFAALDDGAVSGILGVNTTGDPTSITDWNGSGATLSSGIRPGLSSVTVDLHRPAGALASGLRIGWSFRLTGEW